MTQGRCPNCNQIYTIQPHSGDFVHQCNSGDSSLDQEDFINLEMKNWNMRGIENGIDQQGKIEKEREGNYTDRGLNVSVFQQRQHFEHIDRP